VVGSVQDSEFIFIFNGFLVGSIFGFSKFVDPVSRSFLLGINGFLLGSSEGSSLGSNSLLSSFSIGSNGLGGGLSLEGSVGVKPVHSSGIGQGISFSVFNLRVGSDGSDGSLDFVGVNNSGNVSIRQN
jgi:hypothetical protein